RLGSDESSLVRLLETRRIGVGGGPRGGEAGPTGAGARIGGGGRCARGAEQGVRAAGVYVEGADEFGERGGGLSLTSKRVAEAFAWGRVTSWPRRGRSFVQRDRLS